MRGGENSFNHILLVVAQDIKKQMLLNDSSEFVYQLSLDGLAKDDITHAEHVKAVKLLKKRGLIEASQLDDDEGPGNRPNPYTYDTPGLKLSVQVNQTALDKLISELEAELSQIEKQDKRLRCLLYLHDTELILKVDGQEYIIRHLHEGSVIYRLMTELSNPLGRVRTLSEIQTKQGLDENERRAWRGLRDMWQVVGSANLHRFKKLFDYKSPREFGLIDGGVDISMSELESILSKMKEKNRKISGILESIKTS